MSDKTSFQNRLFPSTAMPDVDWWQALWPEPLKVLERTGITQGMTAVDLCCGDGLFTVAMSILLDGRVYAVDLDPELLAIAKHAVKDAGAPPCIWVEGDAREMSRLIPEKVDAVLIANTFHGVPDQVKIARDAFDILKPGGILIIVNWRVLPRTETTVLGQPRGPRFELRMSPEEVMKVVEPAGLVLDRVVDLAPYHYGAIFKKP